MTLHELGYRTGFEPRTIRSYIERKLLPPSYGRGMRAGYGVEHLDRLNFISNVRKKARLSLDEVRSLINSLPNDQVQRVARGEEEVWAAPVLREAPERDSDPTESVSDPQPWFSKTHERFGGAGQGPTPDVWMTATITEGLELRQRGHDPRDLKRMTRLASLLMAWLKEEERARETP